MKEIGIFNPHTSVTQAWLGNLSAIYYNLPEALLYDHALRNGEARLSAQGALCVETGQHTGRSALDKFIVRSKETESEVCWINNKPMTQEHFDVLYADFLAHLQNGNGALKAGTERQQENKAGRSLFVQDLIAGSEKDCALPLRVITEQAWHALFIRNLTLHPTQADLAKFIPELTILHAPSFSAEPSRHGCRSATVIACDFTRKIVLIGGTSYAGEIKKSIFTFLNYTLPQKGIMPMHCSANMGKQGDTAVFFGLSGTGKTTLSATADRTLIGDDEHGWSKKGVFNFEGGCYAKTIRLSPVAEPQIYAAAKRFGTVLENVVLKNGSEPDFDDDSLTENTRAAYPLYFIANASPTGTGGHPKNIIMLTADAFGVLPPVAKLNTAQAMYHFLSGYTAKIAGTEKGITEPQATFSTCFGAPFMPRKPTDYSALLGKLMQEHSVHCWLVNTGWTGGIYGTGHRMPITATRTLLSAILNKNLAQTASFRTDSWFGFAVPVHIDGVDDTLLNPEATWSDKQAYAEQANKLAAMFVDNFKQFANFVNADVAAGAPVAAGGSAK